jgi:hypothetical protein
MMTGYGKEFSAMNRRWLAVSLFILLFTVSNVFAGGAFKFGLDSEGRHKVSGYGLSGTEDVEASVSLAAEFFGPIGNALDLGGGFSLQSPRSQKDYEGDFSFFPVYFAMRVRLLDRDTTPYFIGQLGYNFFFGDTDYKGTGMYAADLDGGLYYGLGGGVIIQKNFLVELLYTENNGSASTVGYDFDVQYSKLTLNFGFNF